MPSTVFDSAIFRDAFDAKRLVELSDPVNYLGSTSAMIDRALPLSPPAGRGSG
jgi:hypothetical protein